MKNNKKLIALLVSLTIPAMIFSGCGGQGSGNSQSATSSASSSEASVSSGTGYQSDAVKKAVSVVTLGQYKGVEVKISDEELKAFANENILTGKKIYTKDETKTQVEADSIVNVNYQGLLDGVAFQGGTAQNVTIDVKNNSDAVYGSGYIPGFTSGLVGAKVGDTVDCPVTFPENYHSAELAGKSVIFRFKVNYICKKVTFDTVDDAFVKENFGIEKAAGFKDYVKKEYKSYLEKNKNMLKRKAIMDTVIENATVKESLSEDEETEYVFLAVCDKEGLTLDDKGYEAYLSNYMSAYGYTDKAEFLKALGDETVLKDYYMAYKAIDLCVDSAKVV